MLIIHKPVSIYEQYMAEFRAQDAAERERREVYALVMAFQKPKADAEPS